MVRPVKREIRIAASDMDDLPCDLSDVDLGSPPIREQQQVPPKMILNEANLKKLRGYREMRHSIKMRNQENEFINQMREVLSYFDVPQRKYDHELVLFVMSVAEDYFLDAKSGSIKQHAVIESIKQFFNNDDDLVQKMIELMMPQLVQNGYLRRMRLKAVNFLKKCLKRCWQN